LAIAITYTAVLFLLSLVPMAGPTGELSLRIGLTPGVQNILHIPLYGLLAVLWLRVANGHTAHKNKGILLVLSGGCVFGVANELVQAFVPGRYADLQDVLLNVVGLVMGVVFFMWVERMKSSFLRDVVCGRIPKHS